jgi:hypothetical protein
VGEVTVVPPVWTIRNGLNDGVQNSETNFNKVYGDIGGSKKGNGNGAIRFTTVETEIPVNSKWIGPDFFVANATTSCDSNSDLGTKENPYLTIHEALGAIEVAYADPSIIWPKKGGTPVPATIVLLTDLIVYKSNGSIEIKEDEVVGVDLYPPYITLSGLLESRTIEIEYGDTALSFPLLTVMSGATLTLENIILDGRGGDSGGWGPDNNYSLVQVSGSLILDDGAGIQNSTRHGSEKGGSVEISNGGKLTMKAGSFIGSSHAGGVYVGIGGVFEKNIGSSIAAPEPIYVEPVVSGESARYRNDTVGKDEVLAAYNYTGGNHHFDGRWNQ